MKAIDIDAMADRYRMIRRAVYEQATLPINGSTEAHTQNQRKFRTKVTSLCNAANLQEFRKSDNAAIQALWHLIWARIRYSGGVRSEVATRQVNSIRKSFDNFEMFTDSSWDVIVSGHKLVRAGTHATRFLQREANYRDCPGDRTDASKLNKTVLIARQLSQFLQTHSRNTPVLEFVTGGLPTSDVWGIHERLMSIGYRGDLTSLHFMMETGFQVVKPDVIMTRLFHEWRWLEVAAPKIAHDLTREKLEKKYTSPSIYRPVIDLARRIVGSVSQESLKQDIGWVTDNPLREFDIFIVKYGQQPEEEFGITRTLHKSGPRSASSRSTRTCSTR